MDKRHNILMRLGSALRRQDKTAIAVEFAIVFAGVLLGTQVSNWNDGRIERAKTVEMVRDLKPELHNQADVLAGSLDYYRITRRYAETAYAGWRGDPQVSNRDFVVASYQASQMTFTGMNIGSWSAIFGSDQLRSLHDQQLRNDLSALMTQDYAVLEQELFTEYRRHVREIIPEEIQDAIRAQCGDRRPNIGSGIVLPSTCKIDLPDELFNAAARDLRAHPELLGQLRWHFAAIASYVGNIDNLQAIANRALDRLGKA